MTVAFPPEVAHIVNSLYPPARQALADAFAGEARRLFVVGTLIQLALVFAFYATGAAAQLREWLERRIRSRFLVAFAFVVIALVVYAAITVPLDYYRSFVLPHAFGLSRESALQWTRDWAVALGLSTVVSAIVAALFVLVAARWPKRWPVIAAIAAAPLVLFAFAIFPVFVAPLFNKFSLLPPSPLTRSILAFAAAQGVRAKVVYVYDLSRQSLEADAYVAGIGATQRIAIADNLLRNFKADEIQYIVAHEMGHYKLGHLWIGAATTWVATVLALVVVYYLGNLLWKDRRTPVPPQGELRSRATGFGDPAALPLVALIGLCYNLLTLPATNAISRNVEHAADAFAVTHVRASDAGVRAFARIANQDLSPLHPPPFVVWYFYTHPPMDERIMFAARAAGRAQPLTGFP